MKHTFSNRVLVISDDADVRHVGVLSGAASIEVPESLSFDAHIRDSLFGDSACAEAVVLHLRRDSPADTADVLDTLLAHVDSDASLKSSLYLVLLLGVSADGEGMHDLPRSPPLPPHLAHLRPRQSCEPLWRPGETMPQISDRYFMCVHRLECCVRVDDAARATPAEIAVRGACGTILLEDVLSEVAYKLGKAAKFGA